jgi:hypothetical protein
MYAEIEYFFYRDAQVEISLVSSTGYFLVLVTLSISCMSFRMINHVPCNRGVSYSWQDTRCGAVCPAPNFFRLDLINDQSWPLVNLGNIADLEAVQETPILSLYC